ncbi:hypothetical protein MMC31_001688 [Peltigera leucophlebia]|nr:hypothetical protein [Peltigera leucophlebia]
MPANYGYPAVGGGNPSLTRTFFSNRGSLELTVSNAYGGLFEISRKPEFIPWSEPTTFGDAFANIIGTSLIESNLTPEGTFELITLNDLGILFHYIHTPSDPHWRGVTDLPNPGIKVQGVPSLIQKTRSGQPKGTFELVVPAATDGGAVHLTRDNSKSFPNQSNYPWSKPVRFGTKLTGITALGLIESNYGTGHLEVAAIAKGKLYWTWRDNSAQWKDFSPILTEYDVVGNPALIQSNDGSEAGNFELVVPAASGGLWYFSRDNNDGTQGPTWLKGIRFGEKEGVFKGVALVQGFGAGAVLEVVAQRAGLLYYYSYMGTPRAWVLGPVAPEKRGEPVK